VDKMSLAKFIFLIPCIINNRFTWYEVNKMHRTVPYIFTLWCHTWYSYFSLRKVPPSGNQTKAISYKTKLATSVHSWSGVTESDTLNVDISLHSCCINMLAVDTDCLPISLHIQYNEN
jgi:hypothetical protein